MQTGSRGDAGGLAYHAGPDLLRLGLVGFPNALGRVWEPSLIFGLLVSTLFTLVVVPMIYFMAYGNRQSPQLDPRPAE